VRQYCYFWIASTVVSSAAITAEIGIAPDRESVLGSRRTEPGPVPVEHGWEIRCERFGRIEAQASEVLARMEPVADKVRKLVDRGDVVAGLMMVRSFNDSAGTEDGMSWWLSREQVQLIARMGADIQSDEYGRPEVDD